MNLELINTDILSFSQTIVLSSKETLNEIAILLPRFFQATVVFCVGWIIGIIIEWMFMKLGQKLRFTNIWEKTGLDSLLKKANIKSPPSKLAGTFIKSVIILFFLRQAVKIMGFSEIELFISDIIGLVPDIIIALLILLFSIQAAGTAGSLVHNLVGIGDKKARTIMAIVAKNVLIAFGVMAALVQVHIAEELVQTLFTALVAMLALAGGLAFGLGGKEFVHDMIEEFRGKKS